MSDGTKIEWTDATLNVVNGCSVISPGCANCYAMRAGGRNLPGHPSTGLTQPSKAGHVWTGEVRFNQTALLQPLAWKRPRRIFWNAHGDLFHDSVPDAWIDQCFAVMAMTPQHSHQVLTKRSARMRAYFHALTEAEEGGIAERREMIQSAAEQLGAMMSAVDQWPLPNVWLGVSVEDQTRADERIPDLLATPAAVRFLSCEPLLGPVDLKRIRNTAEPSGPLNALTGYQAITPAGGHGVGYYFAEDDEPVPQIKWVIVGGESGPGARPTHPDWARSLRDQCAAAGLPFLFKQWGEWRETDGPKTTKHNRAVGKGTHWLNSSGVLRPAFDPGSIYAEYRVAKLGKKAAGRLLDGVQHDGMPT